MSRLRTEQPAAWVRGILVKLSSEARVLRLEAAIGRRLGRLPLVRSIVPRILLWDADAEPRVAGNAVIWRSKYGPRKHLLKRAQPRLSGELAWSGSARGEPGSICLLGATGLEPLLPGVSFRTLTENELAAETDSIRVLVIGTSKLRESSLRRAATDLAESQATVVLWAQELLAEDQLSRIFSDSAWLGLPLVAETEALLEPFRALGFRCAAALGPGARAAVPTSFPDDANPLAGLAKSVPPRDLERIRTRLHGWNLSGLVPPKLVLAGPEQEGMSLRELALAIQGGGILCCPSEGVIQPMLDRAPRLVFASTDELAQKLEGSSDLELAKLSHASARFVRGNLSDVAAARRFSFLAGLPPPQLRRPSVTVLCVSNRPRLLPRVLETFEAFRYPEKKLIVVANIDQVDGREIEELLARAPDVVFQRTTSSMSLGESLNRARRLVDTELWAKMDDDDHYGPNYLNDQIEALTQSGAEIVGKGSYLTFLPGQRALYLKTEQAAQAFSERFVHGGTIVARTESVRDIKFHPVVRGTDSLFLQECRLKGLGIYSTDPFNFAYVRYDATGHHTFDVSTHEVLKGAVRVRSEARVEDADC